MSAGKGSRYRPVDGPRYRRHYTRIYRRLAPASSSRRTQQTHHGTRTRIHYTNSEPTHP